MKTLLQNSQTDLGIDQASEIHDHDSPPTDIQVRPDLDYYIGLICLALSFSIFLLTWQNNDASGSSFNTLFLFSYLVAIFYSAWLLATGKMRLLFWKKQKKEYQAHRLLLCFIWLVSCFSFNHVVPVFHESAMWLTVTIILSAVICILFAWEASMPVSLKQLLLFFFGISTVLWCYYAIYLAWLYPVSIIALPAFGFSVHSFIPLMLCIAHFRIVYQNRKYYRLPLFVGMLVPILFIVFFSVQWYLTSARIRSASNVIATSDKEEFPAWVHLGQTLDNNWITKRVLMGGLVYQLPKKQLSFVPSSTNLGELVRHDPLVMIASLFTPEPELSIKRSKLLDVLYDKRHYTQERLWSGSNLTTDHVITQARIFPDFRLAYTEKTITIGNHSRSAWNQEEALYTFHLPEGSVVSSLSLWINGKEEKGYLTTQTKADSAYKTIVGVESRDPSVIHWQEGNTVRVRVFPCTIREKRKFKIGITSPLSMTNGKLIYENIYFKGPASDNATEYIKLDFSKNVSDVEIPFEMEESGLNTRIANGKYRSSWNIQFDAVPLSDKGFAFNGKTWSVKPFKEISEPFVASTIYLDINKSWAKSDFDSVYQLVKNRKVYIYDDAFVQISEKNKDQLFDRLSGWNYSLFPVHKVPNVGNALLITRETQISPNLKDLQDSEFGNALKNDTASGSLKTFHIGNELSPYIKTLQELRIIRCEKSSVSQISEMLSHNQFPANQETQNVTNPAVAIDKARMIIVENDSTSSQGAPDHIARLYAYNHIMQQMSRRYLSQSYQKDSIMNAILLGEAEKANIVTPVSSLIVLETAQDYKRFDIQKSKNSLDNATLKNAGAVPEPHEWVLIILFVLLVSYYTFRNYVRW